MTHTASTLAPTGPGGLRYAVSQVSLVVQDLDALVRLYHDTFGWAPWRVFDHVEPTHHATELRGRAVPYSLRGAEVQVGSLNFELLQPLEGPSVWAEQLGTHGEGICSIATMFLTSADGDVVKKSFADLFGIGIEMRAQIGDHIEYYYLETQERFGCRIESGSGHAIDFIEPAYTYPGQDGTWGPSPSSGIQYPLTQVSLAVRNLDEKLDAYTRGFGWGPWRVYDSAAGALTDTTLRGRPADYRIRWAETLVGDMNIELVEPIDGTSPWSDFMDRTGGDGLCSVSTAVDSDTTAERVQKAFAAREVPVLAEGRTGNRRWFFLDTEDQYKCLIKSGTGHAFNSDAPYRAQP